MYSTCLTHNLVCDIIVTQEKYVVNTFLKKFFDIIFLKIF